MRRLNSGTLIVAGVIVLVLAVLAVMFTSTDADAGNDQVCSGLDSGKIDVSGSHKTVTVTAPDGYLIDGYCVKAGSANQGNGPEYVTIAPTKTVTFGHFSGKDVSHYSVSYTPVQETCETNPTPENCPQPPADVERRTLSGEPDCVNDTVTIQHQQRSRSYTWDGDEWVAGAWSAWVTTSTTTREATDTECPDEPDLGTQTEQRTVNVVDCEDRVVTTLHQSRTRTETSPGVWGPWSEWVTGRTTTAPATNEDCPLVKDASIRVHKIDGCQQRDDLWVTHKRHIKKVTIRKVSLTKRIVRAVAEDGHLFVPRLGGERVYRKVVRFPNQRECLKGMS